VKADRGFESRPLRFVTELPGLCNKPPQIERFWASVWSHAVMWIGLVYLALNDEVILCAWGPGRGRPFAFVGPRGSVVEMAHALRAAHARDAFVMPRCDHCGAAADLPEL
jgi:hypothetical protein